jgi:hypothetical protein
LENPEKLARNGKAGCAAAQNRYFRRTFAAARSTATGRANREMNTA